MIQYVVKKGSKFLNFYDYDCGNNSLFEAGTPHNASRYSEEQAEKIAVELEGRVVAVAIEVKNNVRRWTEFK